MSRFAPSSRSSASANLQARSRSHYLSGRPQSSRLISHRARAHTSCPLGPSFCNLEKFDGRPKPRRRLIIRPAIDRTPLLRLPRVDSAREPPSSTTAVTKSCAHTPEDSGDIGVDGIRSRKRKASDTDLEFAPASCATEAIGFPAVPQIEGLRQEAEVSRQISHLAGFTEPSLNAQQEDRHMLGRLPLLPSLSRMIFNIYAAFAGIGEKFFRFFNPQYYRVAEVRSFLNGNHVSNKRRKLGSGHEDDDIQWIDHDRLANLIAQFRSFGVDMTMIWECIESYPARQQMNELLEPLTSSLADSPDDIALLDNSDREHDLCQLFFLQFRAGFAFLSLVYEIGLVIRTRNQFKSVPSTLELSFSAEDMITAARISNLLSAPAFLRICGDVVRLTGSQNPGVLIGKPQINLPEPFIDQIILDLEAITRKLPPPSFVQNDAYRDRLRDIFPTPKRTEPDSLGVCHLLPGRFPDERIQPEPQTLVKPDTAPWRRSESVKPSSLAKPQHRFHDEVDVRQAIKDKYVRSFEVKQPLHRQEISTIKSILKKRRFPGRPSPKRLGTHYLPKAVRFTESTLSPVPRGHSGVGIPKLSMRPEPVQARPLRTNGLDSRRSCGTMRPRISLPPQPQLNNHQLERSRFRRSFNLPLDQRPDPDARIKEILDIPSLETLEISSDTKAGIEYQKEQERRRVAEAARKAAEEKRRIAEEKARKEREERLARSGGLRLPKLPLVGPLSAAWQSRAKNTLFAANTVVLAKTGEGVELKRHDFAKVVPPTEWLNDEIVNGSLNWLDQAINSAAGIKDVKKQTRKCLSMSSFFFKRLQDQGVKNTQRTLRRFGVEKRNFLDVDTILLPICEHSHWTLMIIRPSKFTVAHMDSMNPRGSPLYTKLAMAWVKEVLEEKFQANQWKIFRYEAPMQTNGHDCGVHTITNGMCVALGLNPVDCYASADMPHQRIRIASMLLNGGFNGEFDLKNY